MTGGGWINSPEGAYAPDPALTGKANLGLVSKYQQGQSTPSGNTEFNFKAGDLNFHSSSYDWLVITHHKAMYKGTGTINGERNYGNLNWTIPYTVKSHNLGYCATMAIKSYCHLRFWTIYGFSLTILSE